MNVIVGVVDDKMRAYLKQSKFDKKTIVIDKMCNVKYLTEPIHLYIPFGKINKIGLVENTFVHVEELVISANVIHIYYGNILNEEKLKRISNLFEVPVTCIDIK